MWKSAIFSAILLIGIISSVTLAQSRKCIVQDNCEKCLLADPACAWCTDRNYNLKKPRCMTHDELIAAGCDGEAVYQNSYIGLEILENKATSDYSSQTSSSSSSSSSVSSSSSSSSNSSSSSSSSGSQSGGGGGGAASSSSGSSFGSSSSSSHQKDAIQIQPQRVKLTIAKGQTQTFKMTYRPAKNYPLDLYYLMDLTWTMRDDQDMLERMANKIASKIYSLTENYRIGFGSFADKTVMPFALMADKYRENPCAPEQAVCGRGYGFRHRLDFTTDMESFIAKVNSSEITANLDNNEGGLDALMQIMVCGERIGWAERTRKIIVFATDSKSHLAGEGKLAGIVRRNDGQCHLDETGEYNGTLEYDYPSLEQIYRELLRNKMNVIFAVANDYVHHYDLVHQLLKEMSSVGILKLDSSNIIQLIEKGYQEFLKRVHFIDDAPENVKIEYFTDCGGYYKELKSRDRCDNIEVGKSYDFYVNVTVLKESSSSSSSSTSSSSSWSKNKRGTRDVGQEDASPDGQYRQFFRIEESSLSEGVDIELEIRELCGCLQDEKPEVQSALCSSAGDYTCGMCFCEPGRGGKTCECDMSESTSDKQLEMNCRMPRMDKDNFTTYGPVCSETGTCLCGQCHCYKGRNGQYCECGDCPRYNGVECGGADRAFCDCGECVCHNGWTGERCDCNPSQDKCFPPNSETLCSGNGDCDCGSCKCDFGFAGDFCESKSGEDSALCLYYEPCVKCLISRNSNETSCADLAKFCTDKNGREFDFAFDQDLDEERIRCVVRMKRVDKSGNELDDVCEHYFTYEVKEQGQSELVIAESSCAPVNFAFLGGIIILVTLLLGFAIFLIIKTWFWYSDRRIMAEFHKHQNETTYEETSPLYKSPWTHYEVPEEYRMSQDGQNRESFVVKETAFN